MGAAFLPHVKASTRDLQRGKRPKPSSAFLGKSFQDAMEKLNEALLKESDLKTRRCSEFSIEELHHMQRWLFDARSPKLNSIYSQRGDTRRMAHVNITSLESEQAKHVKLYKDSPDLAAKVRDGACHEMVMWYIHHLSASAREEVKKSLVLPLLPQGLHAEPPASAPPTHKDTHSRYMEQASCAVCHVSTNAGLLQIVV